LALADLTCWRDCWYDASSFSTAVSSDGLLMVNSCSPAVTLWPSLTDRSCTVPEMPGCTSVTSETMALPLPLTVACSVCRVTCAVVTFDVVPPPLSIGKTIAATPITRTASSTHQIQCSRFFGFLRVGRAAATSSDMVPPLCHRTPRHVEHS
jgi:hypothetical protein